MDGHRENSPVVVFVYIVERIFPHTEDIMRIMETETVGGFLNEHQRRNIVQIPVCRNFNQIGLFAADQRFHPGGSRSGIIDLAPGIANADIIRQAVVMHQGMVVFNAVFFQQLVGNRGELPPGSHIARGAMAGQLGNQFDALDQDIFFLLRSHCDGIFMCIAVGADFMAVSYDHLHLFGESLDGVARCEPGYLDVVLLE